MAEKKTKRAGKKNKKKESEKIAPDTLKIYYNNINGFMARKESFNQAINAVAPDIVGLCETKLGRLSKPKIQGFESVYTNMKQGKEGLLVAAREGTFLSIEKMTPDTDEDGDQNILAVQIKYPKFSLRVIVAHAPQEKVTPDVRERFFQSLKLETERGELNGDSILVMGDMNGRVDCQETKETPTETDTTTTTATTTTTTTTTTPTSSPNGKALKEFMTEHGLFAANFHHNTIGKWTRIQQTKKNTEMSAIDYILLDEYLYSAIANLIVDECKAFTPYGVNIEKGLRKVVFSDHCAMIMSITVDIGTVTCEVKPKETWKITESGLKKYKELTSTRTLFFPESDRNTTDMYRLWSNVLENTLDKCFKKKSMGKRSEPQRRSCMGSTVIRSVLNKIAAKGKIQRDVVLFFRKKLLEKEMRVLEEIRVEKLKNTLSQFSEEEKTPPNAYWKVLKSVRVKEKTKITSVMKSDGVEVFSKEAIKHEILDEFKTRLRNRQPSEGWEDYVEITNKLVELLLDVDGEDGPDFTLEELVLAIKKLKRNKAPGPDDVVSEFILEAGDGILYPLLEILNEIKKSKQPPKQWNSAIKHEISFSLKLKNRNM
jgi:exonuclease III